MRIVVFYCVLALVASLLVGSSAQAQETSAPVESYDAAFEARFGQSDDDYGRGILRLRVAGWVLAGIAHLPLWIGASFNGSSDAELERAIVTLLVGAIGGSVVTAIGFLCLTIARVRVFRRRKFRERFAHEHRTSSYFDPSLDVSVTLGGVALDVSF